jgi:hypothetical protein
LSWPIRPGCAVLASYTAAAILPVMAMAIELARFTVDDDAVDPLVAGRPAMVQALKKRFPGCLAAYLTREDDGSWLDIVLWRSRAEAEEAARLIGSVPECAAWFRNIATSGGLRHVEVVHAWPAVGFPEGAGT